MRLLRFLLSGLRLRKSFKLGPWRAYFTERGYSSTTAKLGPWSRNSRSRRDRVNLWGPLHWIDPRRGRS